MTKVLFDIGSLRRGYFEHLDGLGRDFPVKWEAGVEDGDRAVFGFDFGGVIGGGFREG